MTGEFFTVADTPSPINGTVGLQYIYIGQIDLGSWFPDPMAAETLPVI